jgi:hypothetical protein
VTLLRLTGVSVGASAAHVSSRRAGEAPAAPEEAPYTDAEPQILIAGDHGSGDTDDGCDTDDAAASGN